MAGIAGYTVGFPSGWYRWEVGGGAQVAEGIAERAADSPQGREVVRRGVLGLDELCVKEAAAITETLDEHVRAIVDSARIRRGVFLGGRGPVFVSVRV